jgi:hypothetical protein
MAIKYATNALGDITFGSFPLIHLTEQAVSDVVYPVAGASYVRYVAPGKDDEGNEYLVYWNTTKEWDEQWATHNAEQHGSGCGCNYDESSACDWDNPVAVVEM